MLMAGLHCSALTPRARGRPIARGSHAVVSECVFRTEWAFPNQVTVKTTVLIFVAAIALGPALMCPGGPAWATSGNAQKGSGGTISERPLTVTVELSEELRGGLAEILRDPRATIRLRVADLTLSPGARRWVEGVRVFANLPTGPGPDDLTVDSAYWVGAHVFGEIKRSASPRGFYMDLKPSLVRQTRAGDWSPNMPLRITFELILEDKRPRAANIAVSVGTVTVSTHREP